MNDSTPQNGENLSELEKYEILDTGRDADFDEIVEIAREICDAPIALISLVDRERQWFKAKSGVGDISETPISTSVCAFAVRSDEDVFVVEDLSRDERFAHMSLVVSDPKLRFYAGAPIRTAAGVAIGSVCVLSPTPGRLDASKRRVLKALARQVMNLLEARLATRRAERSEEMAHRVLDSIPQMAWIADAEGNVDWYNRRWYEYTGKTFEEMKGHGWMEVQHPDHAQRVMEKVQNAFADGELWEDTFPLKSADGRYRSFLSRAVPLRDKNGAVVKWLGTNTDIEDQRRAAEEVRTARAHLALIVESARDFAIISLDTQGRIISWNPGAERIFGFTSDEAICRSIDLIFTPEDIANGAAEREVRVAGEAGRSSDERWHIRKDESRFFASGIMAAMVDEAGRLCGFTKIARDITVQKEAEQALIAARNTAEAANIAKSEFLANMSHEIRTPMNAIIGLASILGASQPLTDKQRQFVKTLQLSADALLALINDLLDISKIEAQSVELEQIPFSLFQMVAEVISMMSVRAREKNLTFTAHAESVAGRMFMGDPSRLRQIVLNLCSNAVKFTDQGGIEITVTCDDGKDGFHRISIAVADSGIGIPADKLETIFQKFVQADSSVNRKYGGTGLGLAITKTLTEIMGGTIEVVSAPGEGSTFIVRLDLPGATDMVPHDSVFSLSAPMVAESAEFATRRVLLVEDYAPNVLVAATFLEKFGLPHDVAGSGEEAVERIKTGLYDVVLMDVQMHQMNGLEATRIVRAWEKADGRPRTPIIGMTAHALAGDRERCIGAGMDDYLSKPFHPDELRSKLMAAIAVHRDAGDEPHVLGKSPAMATNS